MAVRRRLQRWLWPAALVGGIFRVAERGGGRRLGELLESWVPPVLMKAAVTLLPGRVKRRLRGALASPLLRGMENRLERRVHHRLRVERGAVTGAQITRDLDALPLPDGCV